MNRSLHHESKQSQNKRRDAKNFLISLDSVQKIREVLSFELSCCKICVETLETNGGADSDLIGGCGQCEFGLWRDLVSKQIPRSTPLHPKSLCGMKLSTSRGLDIETFMDDDQIQRRNMNKRFLSNPRLFQLMPGIVSMKGSGDRNLAKSRRKRREQKLQSASINYDLQASTCNDAWGYPLSLSISKEVNEVEEMLLRGTEIILELNSESEPSIKCCPSSELLTVLDLNDKVGGIGGKKYLTLGSFIWRVLFIVSRGKFLQTKSFDNSFSRMQTQTSDLPESILKLMRGSENISAICAQWLFHDDFFPLHLFLASRFEVSLLKNLEKMSSDQDCAPRLCLAQEDIRTLVQRSTKYVVCEKFRQSLDSFIPRRLRDIPTFQRYLPDLSRIEIITYGSLSLKIPLLMICSRDFTFLWSIISRAPTELAKINTEKFLDSIDPKGENTSKTSKRKKKKRRVKQRAKRKNTETTASNYTWKDSKLESNYEVPSQDIPSKKRNQAIILSLSILDEILNGIFPPEVQSNKLIGDMNTDENTTLCQGKTSKGNAKDFHDRELQDNELIFNQNTLRLSNRTNTDNIAAFKPKIDFASVGMSLGSSGAFEDWSNVIGIDKQRNWLMDLFEERKIARASSTAASIASSSSESEPHGYHSRAQSFDDYLDSYPDSPTLHTKLDPTLSEENTKSFEHASLSSLPTTTSLSNCSNGYSPNIENNVRIPPQYVTLEDIGKLRRSCSLEIKDHSGNSSSSPVFYYKSKRLSLSQDNLRLLLRKEKDANDQGYRERAVRINKDEETKLVNDVRIENTKHVDSSRNNNVEPEELSASESVKEVMEALSYSALNDRINSLTEKCDAYRDVCFSLGAEVSKLRNMLASLTHESSTEVSKTNIESIYPEYSHYGRIGEGGAQTVVGSFSVACLSQRDDSEYGDGIAPGDSSSTGIQWMSQSSVCSGGVHHSNGPVSELDVLSDHGLRFHSRCHLGNEHTISGFFMNDFMQSRLSLDIYNFVDEISERLTSSEKVRQTVECRIWKVVTALWPRAQVKLYGSHTCNLSLPSSDLDFVVCLPAVHKKAPADAPGVLEGRNAIKEPYQKVLARKLKGESWLDPRSVKTIERTAVPVIKVMTKDRREKVLQLDISFATPEHHGLQAIRMVKSIMEEFPIIRPLVLVLKQFLQTRGLLTPYTGGLSSYCLFLMVTRYLQESPSMSLDCGALLVGICDFYGNVFDPRHLGISVKNRQYFCRSITSFKMERQSISQPSPKSLKYEPNQTLSRRHSFHEKEIVTESAGPYRSMRHNPKEYSPRSNHTVSPKSTTNSNETNFSGKAPYTFDPLFVEDPLNPSNNVGRNAFRIFQVKRAFADAHRALVASLEWDLTDTLDEDNGDCSYPLLKCLLQNEDMVLY